MHTCDVCLNYVKNRLHKLKFNPQGLHLIDMLCLTEPRKLDKKKTEFDTIDGSSFEAVSMQDYDVTFW